MSPLDYKCDCSGSSPDPICLYIYRIDNLNDFNWGSYNIVSLTNGLELCSALTNPPIGGIKNYAQTNGINGLSDWYGDVGIIPNAIGGIISYYGAASFQAFYNFYAVNSINQPANVSGWFPATSCELKCFEHPFPKPDFVVAKIQLDSLNNLNLNFAPTGASPWILDFVVGATVTDFEIILQSIYGAQVTVTTQITGSGNIILRINNIYTDQITFTMAGGGVHIMSEVPC